MAMEGQGSRRHADFRLEFALLLFVPLRLRGELKGKTNFCLKMARCHATA
jgi:hypothetical protein